MLSLLLNSLLIFASPPDVWPSFENTVTTLIERDEVNRTDDDDTGKPHMLQSTWNDSKGVMHTVQTDCTAVPTAQQCALLHKMMVDQLQIMFPPIKQK